MADKTTWIKIDRNIMQWQWYKDHNTKDVFIHMLLKANVKPHNFKGVTVGRGELVTSINSLASETGLSLKNVRTALKHLEATGEVAIKRHSRFSVISILSYDRYQGNRHSSGQSSGNQVATIKEYKKDINIQEEREQVPLSAREVSSFVFDNGLDVDPEAFWNYYEANGWVTAAGTPVRNWKALCRTWNGKPKYTSGQTTAKDLFAGMTFTEELYDPE